MPFSNPVRSDTEISHTVTEADKLELMLIIYYLYQQMHIHIYKGKAVPLQAWTGPEGSRRLRLPDFKTIGT